MSDSARRPRPKRKRPARPRGRTSRRTADSEAADPLAPAAADGAPPARRGIQFDERMSEADALMWNIERDPMLRSTILSVMILDRAPDPARLRVALARSLQRVPRLRQRVALDPLGVAPPRWELDPNFDLAYHVRRARAPGKGTLRELLDFAAPIAMQAFDKERPLWELIQLDDMELGQSAIVLKLHHSISDGVGLVRMTSSLVERTRDPEPHRRGRVPSLLEEPAHPDEPHGPFQEALAALRYEATSTLGRTARLARGAARFAGRAALAPGRTAAELAGLAGSLARLLRPVREPLSPLLTARSLTLRLDALATTLGELRRAAHAAGGTVNDAFVAAVTGGLRRYHEHHGRPVAALRMTMPINLREGERGGRAGNQFAPARFAVPIAIADPIERMREIRRLVAQQRAEPALPLTEEIAAALGRLPRPFAVSLFGSMLKAVDFVTSNVPGPQFPVYASGARVVRMFGYGPLSGAAANVTAFSYDGRFEIGVNVDHAAIPDAGCFVRCLREGLDEVLAVA